MGEVRRSWVVFSLIALSLLSGCLGGGSSKVPVTKNAVIEVFWAVSQGPGLPGVRFLKNGEAVTGHETDADGRVELSLKTGDRLVPQMDGYVFWPAEVVVSSKNPMLEFVGNIVEATEVVIHSISQDEINPRLLHVECQGSLEGVLASVLINGKPGLLAALEESSTMAVTNSFQVLVKEEAEGSIHVDIGQGVQFDSKYIEPVLVDLPKSVFAGGAGTSASPYLVELPEQLDAVRGHLQKYFLQIADLDLASFCAQNEQGWEPIGIENEEFEGVYDGNGYAISNLRINRADQELVGLFGSIAGTVKNVNLLDVDMHGGTWTGGLAGWSWEPISSCSATGVVHGHNEVGGLVGALHYGSLINCHSDATVKGQNRVGGLVGVLFQGAMQNSSASGEVTADGVGAGGAVGFSKESEIVGCRASGPVRGQQQVGGLAGTASGVILNSSAAGGIGTSKKDPELMEGMAGGLLGGVYDTIIISGCYATGYVVSHDSVGGLVGDMNDGAILNSYATGDVSGTFYLGGLVGSMATSEDSEHILISRSYALGQVTGDTSMGGLVGFLPEHGEICDCFALGNVTAKSYVGGLAASNHGKIHRSYAAGQVTSLDSWQCGGLVGEIDCGQVFASYYDQEASDQSDTGRGEPRLTAEMKQQATFVDWDFTSTWAIDEGVSYPYLQWKGLP